MTLLHSFVVAIPTALLVGAAIGLGNPTLSAVVAGGSGVLIAGGAFTRVHPRIWRLEIPLALILCSTLVWRIRDTSALTDQPLDAAGMVRVALLAAAVWLALIAVPIRKMLGKISGPTLFYLGFAGIVLAGVPLAVSPALVAFRGIELLSALFVVAAAVASDPDRWLPRAVRVLVAFTAASLAVIFIEAALFPHLALRPVSDFGPFEAPIPFRLEGVVPHVTANTVGTYGVFLVILSAYSASTRLLGSLSATLFGVMGVAAVLASQYRTGYIALALVLIVLAAHSKKHRRIVLGMAISGLVLLTMGFTNLVTTGAQALFFRGQSEEAVASLTGREHFWESAIAVWAESPLLGTGLSSGTRYEVLTPLGLETTSTIHSTWVEALVGTGLIGLAFLAAAFVSAIFQAVRLRLIIPIALLAALVVRSVTGTSVELMGYQAVLFLIVMQWVHASKRDRELVDSADATVARDGRTRWSPAFPS